MKYILISIGLFFLTLTLQIQAQSTVARPLRSKNNLLSQKLKGNVRLVTTYTYSIKDEFHPARTSKSETHYNKAGNVLRTTYYNDISSNKISYEMEFVYDSKGSLIKTIRKYGGRTKIIDHKRNQSRQLVGAGKSFGPLSSRVVYNSIGKRITESNYYGLGKLRPKVIYQYDLRENLIETITYDSDGELQSKQAYKYDKRNYQIEETFSKATGLFGWKRTKYDQQGNPVYVVDSNLSNVGGLPAKKIDEDIYAQTFRYDNLDKHNNWLRQRLILDGKVMHMVRRKIEYY